ncbi:MAG TPA: cupin domain-containing protein [Gemmataceae bacterium]|nr:cupin domain-containing protein [Gemmataceae bacterium]
MVRRSQKVLVIAVLVAFAGSAGAQDTHKVVRVEEITWIDHPIFKGAKTAILVGDPTKAEVIVQRVKFPPNYRVPPHTHPYAEIVTVLTGSYGNTFADKSELGGTTKGPLMRTGSLFVLPANHPHHTWTADEETIVQVQFVGPGGVTLINPADDPRQK